MAKVWHRLGLSARSAAVLLVLAQLACEPGGYSPTDTALGWRDGELVFFRAQTWAWEDVGESTCEGSGVFRLAGDRQSEIAMGDAACDLLYAQSWDLSPDGMKLLIGHRGVGPLRSGISLVDFASEEVLHFDSELDESWIGDPVWMDDGLTWVYLSEGTDGTQLRATQSDPSRSRLLLALGVRHRIEAWDSTRATFFLRRTLPDSTYKSLVVEVDTLGSVDGEWRSTQVLSWAPHGNVVALVRREMPVYGLSTDVVSPEDGVLVVRDLSTGQERELFRSSESSTFSRGFGPIREGVPRGPLLWSEDGAYVVFGRSYDRGRTIWRVTLADGAVAQLTQHDPRNEPSR